jgi:DMSO/TMAO reductase YedYZ molybdopterin-dependent catalytic subunit
MNRSRGEIMLRRLLVFGGLLLILATVGCGGTAGTENTTVATGPGTNSTGTSTVTPTTGDLEPIVVPTLPAEIPGYTQVDPATGLHMTGTPKVIDLASYRLKVDGKVTHELSLSYDDLRRLPKVTATPTLVCEGYFTDTTTWSGVPLETVLEMAGVQPDAEQITMQGADGYSASLTLDEALEPENFLAYEWMGQPLPVLHGFPLRAVIPGKDGNRWVKWLLEIVVE